MAASKSGRHEHGVVATNHRVNIRRICGEGETSTVARGSGMNDMENDDGVAQVEGVARYFSEEREQTGAHLLQDVYRG